MTELPQRITNHILETKSRKHFDRYIPDEWVVNEFKTDYGTDLNVEVVHRNDVSGIHFSVQLKSKLKEKNTKSINVDGIKRSTINRWMNRLEPTLITCYVDEEKETYWTWFSEQIIDLTSEKKKLRVKVPRSNTLSSLDWNHIIADLKRIYDRRHLLFNMPEVNFGELTDIENIAWSFYLLGNYEKARFFIQEALNDRESVALLNALAMCHYELFNYSDALKWINKALKGSSEKSIEILNSKACILIEYGLQQQDKVKVLEGKRILEDVLTTKITENANTHFNYANALVFLSEFELAEYEYKKALSITPNYTEAWKNLGSLYNKMEKYDRELECYEKALTIDPFKSEALMSKGVTLLKIFQNPKKALPLMLQAYELSNDFDKNFLAGYFWISQAYQDLNEFEKALEWTLKGLEVNPGDEYLLNQKAYLYTKTWKHKLNHLPEVRGFFEDYLDTKDKIPNQFVIIHELAQIRSYQKEEFEHIWTELIAPSVSWLKLLDIRDLHNISMNNEMLLNSVRTIDRYQEYRYNFPIVRYHATILERLPFYTINSTVIDLLNSVFMSSFNLLFTAIDNIKESNAFDFQEDIMEGVFEFLALSLPKITKQIFEAVQTLNVSDLKHRCCLLMPHISIIELRSQLEYLLPLFGLKPEPLVEAFIEPSIGQVWFQYLFLASSQEVSPD